MSDDSNAGSSSSNDRKRARRSERWVKSVVKRKRNTGQSYVSRTTNELVEARVIGLPCNDGCFGKVTRHVIEAVFTEFWDIGDYDLQNVYIQKLVQKVEVKRRRKPIDSANPGPTRTCNLQYTVRYQNTLYNVCKLGFLSMFGLKRRRVENAVKNMSAALTPQQLVRDQDEPRQKQQDAGADEQYSEQLQDDSDNDLFIGLRRCLTTTTM